MIEVHSSAEQLGGYFRGLLDDASSATVEAHCAACSACATRLRDEARLELTFLQLAEEGLAPVQPRTTRGLPSARLAPIVGLVGLAAAAALAFAVARPRPATIARDVPPVAAAPSPAAGDTAAPPAEHHLTLARGSSLHFRVPGVTAFHSDGDAVSVMVGNDDVMVVGDVPGESRIFFMTTTGETRLYVVTVTAQPPR